MDMHFIYVMCSYNLYERMRYLFETLGIFSALLEVLECRPQYLLSFYVI